MRRERSATPAQRLAPPSDSVTPPALRAIGCGPTIRHAVSLPSIVRCTRIHVVNGRRFSAGRGRVGQVDCRHAKPARLEHEIQRLQCAFHRAVRRRGRFAPDPQQAIEIDPRGDDRRQVEAIEGIDEGGNLAAVGRGRHRLQQQRGAPGRGGAGNFGQFPARQTAVQDRIERRGAGGRHEPVALTRLERGGQRAIKFFSAERGFEDGDGRMRHIFALCSPYYISQSRKAIKKRKSSGLKKAGLRTRLYEAQCYERRGGPSGPPTYQLRDSPAPPGAATGVIVTCASPWPIVTVQPDTMPTAAPNATSLRKCRLS